MNLKTLSVERSFLSLVNEVPHYKITAISFCYMVVQFRQRTRILILCRKIETMFGVTPQVDNAFRADHVSFFPVTMISKA